MKRIFYFLFTLLLCITSCSLSPKKVSIIGDSYSTFQGYVIPDTNLCYYGVPNNGVVTDVKRAEDTWWFQFINKRGYQLEYNNSYSGGTICNTGYEKIDFTDRSFVTRMKNIGEPDIIIIFGGTNDTWAGSPIGEYQYDNWEKEDLYFFRPAFSYLLEYLSKHHPKAQIYNITNTELSKEITESMDEICQHYKIPNIHLHNIEKQNGHPTLKGMQDISNQLEKHVLQ